MLGTHVGGAAERRRHSPARARLHPGPARCVQALQVLWPPAWEHTAAWQRLVILMRALPRPGKGTTDDSAMVRVRLTVHGSLRWAGRSATCSLSVRGPFEQPVALLACAHRDGTCLCSVSDTTPACQALGCTGAEGVQNFVAALRSCNVMTRRFSRLSGAWPATCNSAAQSLPWDSRSSTGLYVICHPRIRVGWPSRRLIRTAHLLQIRSDLVLWNTSSCADQPSVGIPQFYEPERLVQPRAHSAGLASLLKKTGREALRRGAS